MKQLERKVVSGLMLTLLVVSMLTLAFNLQQVKAEPKTWYVDDDGGADFSSIQEAINAASPGDIVYVYNGTYYENVVANKIVSLIGENRNATIVDGNGTGNVIHVTSNNVTITGFTMQNAGSVQRHGLYLYNSSGVDIHGNIIRNNVFGFEMVLCNRNMVYDNIILNNGNATRLSQSNENIITDNLLSDNYVVGIRLRRSNANIIKTNTLSRNGDSIHLVSSGGNTIYHNNLINNDWGAGADEESLNNTWDNSYPSGGNYWSDYTDADLHSGLYQNETGSDGIWDHPYTIDANNKDRYPLVEPYVQIEKYPPVAVITAPTEGYVSEEIAFSGSYSYDPDGGLLTSFQWNFGDGINSTEQNPTHTYTLPGTYEVTLVVSDDEGQVSEPATHTLRIKGLVETIQELIEAIKSWNLPKGTENKLTSKLEEAIHLLNKGNGNGAAHKLMQFIDEVEALRGKKPTTEQKEYLISEAQRVVDLIRG